MPPIAHQIVPESTSVAVRIRGIMRLDETSPIRLIVSVRPCPMKMSSAVLEKVLARFSRPLASKAREKLLIPAPWPH